jgi:lipopolysaccharide export system protein LptA
MTGLRFFPSCFRAVAGCAALAAALLLVTPLKAQTLTNTFGGLSQSSKDPIDIESDVLVVHDQQKYATFKGSVKAVQGTTTLRADQLDVHYVGGGDKLATGKGGTAEALPAKATGGGASAAADDGAEAKITKIEAKGSVIITSDQDQTTTSDWALYDVPAQMVTVGGNVVLTQGQNVLKGDRLVIDLKTGESRFENPGNTPAGGRIRALFMPKADANAAKAKDEKPGDAKPADATAATSGATAGGGTGAAEPAAGSEDAASPAEDAAPSSPKPAAQDNQPWSLIPGFAQ